MCSSPGSVRERPQDLDLDRAFDQAILLAARVERGEVWRLAVRLERRVVGVGLVEHEQVRILGRPVWPIDQATGLGLADDRGLLREQLRQCVALALRCPKLCNHREY